MECWRVSKLCPRLFPPDGAHGRNKTGQPSKLRTFEAHGETFRESGINGPVTHGGAKRMYFKPDGPYILGINKQPVRLITPPTAVRG